MNLSESYTGKLESNFEKSITAGEIGSWELTYTAGEYGIDDGGSLVIAWRSVSDWQTPQFTDPSGLGYTTLSTTADAVLQIYNNKFVRPFGNSLLITVKDGFVKKGDIIKITLGDRSGGSPGIRAQTFCEAGHEFRAYLDAGGTRKYEKLERSAFVKITAGYPEKLQAVISSTADPARKPKAVIRVLDEYGNPASRFSGKIDLYEVRTSEDSSAVYSERRAGSVELSPDDGGAKTIYPHISQKAGWWFLKAVPASEGKKSKISEGEIAAALSNPSYYGETQNHIFWGDWHGQTDYTIGTGSLDDYYDFARYKGAVDFSGWQGNDFEITDENWKHVREITKAHNDEGNFLTFLGYEWSGVTPAGGDHNIFFLGDEETFYPSSDWISGDRTSATECFPVESLWKKLHGRDDIIAIPHIGGRYANLDWFNPEFTSIVEIHSHHGIFEWFALDAMKRRLKVGFTAQSDDHTCRPGMSYPLTTIGETAAGGAFDVPSGLMGVFAKSLTKKDIWDAVRKRHVYASTIDRLFVKTSVGEFITGDEFYLNCSEDREKAFSGHDGRLVFKVSAAGHEPLETLDLYDWEKKIAEYKIIPHEKRGRIRIRWSGVRKKGREKKADWTGFIYVEKGFIRSAEEYSFDFTNQGIVEKNSTFIRWISTTSGDYDGVILDIEGGDDTVIHFTSSAASESVNLKDIYRERQVFDEGGVNLRLEFDLAVKKLSETEALNYRVLEKDIDITDYINESSEDQHALWVKVTETDGNAAWSSPVFISGTR